MKNKRTKINKNKKLGVYKLRCGSCTKQYGGRTLRILHVRFSGHKRSFYKTNNRFYLC